MSAAERISDPRFLWFEKTACAYFRCRAADVQRALDRDEVRRDLTQFFDSNLWPTLFVLHDSTVSPPVVTVALGSAPVQDVMPSSPVVGPAAMHRLQLQMRKNINAASEASAAGGEGDEESGGARKSNNFYGDITSIQQQLRDKKDGRISPSTRRATDGPTSLVSAAAQAAFSSTLGMVASAGGAHAASSAGGGSSAAAATSAAAGVGGGGGASGNAMVHAHNRKRYLLLSRLGKERLNVESMSTRLSIVELSADLLGSAAWMLRSVVYPLLASTPVAAADPVTSSGVAAVPTDNSVVVGNSCRRTVGTTAVTSNAALDALCNSVRSVTTALVPLVASLHGSVVLSHSLQQHRDSASTTAEERRLLCLRAPDVSGNNTTTTTKGSSAGAAGMTGGGGGTGLVELERCAQLWIAQLNRVMDDFAHIDDLDGPEGYYRGDAIAAAAAAAAAAVEEEAKNSNNSEKHGASSSSRNSSGYSESSSSNNHSYQSQADIVCPIRRPLNEVQRRRHRLHVLQQALRQMGQSAVVLAVRRQLMERSSPLFQPLERAVQRLVADATQSQEDLRYLEPLVPLFKLLDAVSASSASSGGGSGGMMAASGGGGGGGGAAGAAAASSSANSASGASAASASSLSSAAAAAGAGAGGGTGGGAGSIVTAAFVQELAEGLMQRKVFVALGVIFARNDHMGTSEIIGGLARGVVEGVMQKILAFCSIEYLFNDNARDLIDRIELAMRALKATKDALAYLVQVSVTYRNNMKNNKSNNNNNNTNSNSAKSLLPFKTWRVPPALIFDRLDRLVERMLEVSQLASKKQSQMSDTLSALPGPAAVLRRAVIKAEERRSGAISDFQREGLSQIGALSSPAFDTLLMSLNETLAACDMSVADAACKFAQSAPLDADTLDTMSGMAPVFAAANLHQLWFKSLDELARQWIQFGKMLEGIVRSCRRSVGIVLASAEVLYHYQQATATAAAAPHTDEQSAQSSLSRHVMFLPTQLVSQLCFRLCSNLIHASRIYEGMLACVASSPIDVNNDAGTVAKRLARKQHQEQQRAARRSVFDDHDLSDAEGHVPIPATQAEEATATAKRHAIQKPLSNSERLRRDAGIPVDSTMLVLKGTAACAACVDRFLERTEDIVDLLSEDHHLAPAVLRNARAASAMASQLRSIVAASWSFVASQAKHVREAPVVERQRQPAAPRPDESQQQQQQQQQQNSKRKLQQAFAATAVNKQQQQRQQAAAAAAAKKHVPGLSDADVSAARFIAPLYRLIHSTNIRLIVMQLPVLPVTHTAAQHLDEISGTESRLVALRGLLARHEQVTQSLEADAHRALVKGELEAVSTLLEQNGAQLRWHQTRQLEHFISRLSTSLRSVGNITTFLVHSPGALEETFRRLSVVQRFQPFPLPLLPAKGTGGGGAGGGGVGGVMAGGGGAGGGPASASSSSSALQSGGGGGSATTTPPFFLELPHFLETIQEATQCTRAAVVECAKRFTQLVSDKALASLNEIKASNGVAPIPADSRAWAVVVERTAARVQAAYETFACDSLRAATHQLASGSGGGQRQQLFDLTVLNVDPETARHRQRLANWMAAAWDIVTTGAMEEREWLHKCRCILAALNSYFASAESSGKGYFGLATEIVEVDGLDYRDSDDDDDDDDDDDEQNHNGEDGNSTDGEDAAGTSGPLAFGAEFTVTAARAVSRSGSVISSTAQATAKDNDNKEKKDSAPKKYELQLMPSVNIEISAGFLRSAIHYNFSFASEFVVPKRHEEQQQQQQQPQQRMVDLFERSSSDDDDKNQSDENQQQAEEEKEEEEEVERSTTFAVRCRETRSIAMETQELSFQLDESHEAVHRTVESLLGPMLRLWSCVDASQVLREELAGDFSAAAEEALAAVKAGRAEANSGSSSSSAASAAAAAAGAATPSANQQQQQQAFSEQDPRHLAALEVDCIGSPFSVFQSKLHLYQRASQSIVEDVPDAVLARDWVRLDLRKIRSKMRELAFGVELCLCEHLFSKLCESLARIENLIAMLDESIRCHRDKAFSTSFVAMHNNDSSSDSDSDEGEREREAEQGDGGDGDEELTEEKMAIIAARAAFKREQNDSKYEELRRQQQRESDAALLAIVECLREIEHHRGLVPRKFPILSAVVNLLLSHTSGPLRAECLQAEVRLGDLPMEWDAAIRRALSTRDALAGRILDEQNRLCSEGNAVNGEVSEWVEKTFMRSAPTIAASLRECFDDRTGAVQEAGFTAVYVMLDEQFALLARRREHLLGVRNLQRIYDAVPVSLDAVDAAQQDVVEAKHLWDFIAHATSMIRSWYATPLRPASTGPLTDAVRFLRESLFKRPKHLRDWPVFRQLDETLRFLFASFPCVNDVASASLKARHWQDLAQSCSSGDHEQHEDSSSSGMHSKNSGSIFSSSCSSSASASASSPTSRPFVQPRIVGQLVGYNLPAHMPDMGRILEQAEKEAQIERALDEIRQVWDDATVPVMTPPLSLPAVRMRSEGLSMLLARGPTLADFECALLVGADDMIELAQEHSARLQSMLSSRWAAVFVRTLEKYQKLLTEAETALAAWADVQRQWLSLRPIYAAGSDLLKQLPQHADAFRVAESQLVERLRTVTSSSRVLDVCNDKLEKTLLTLSEDFQHCEQGLARYLASKRQRFARFYFLSDSDLIDLLASAHDPRRACTTHIGRVIEAVETVSGCLKHLALGRTMWTTSSVSGHYASATTDSISSAAGLLLTPPGMYLPGSQLPVSSTSLSAAQLRTSARRGPFEADSSSSEEDDPSDDDGEDALRDDGSDFASGGKQQQQQQQQQQHQEHQEQPTKRKRHRVFVVRCLKSRESELLYLAQPVALEQSVDAWLQALLAESQRTVVLHILRACATFTEQRRPAWMFSNITQATTVAMRTIWTRDVTSALDSVDRGNANAIADISRQHQSGLTELIEIVSGNLPTLKRKAVITWITIAVHQRDVLGELAESLEGADAGSSTQYIWQRQMRFYVQTVAAEPSGNASGRLRRGGANRKNASSFAHMATPSLLAIPSSGGLSRATSGASMNGGERESHSEIQCKISDATFIYKGEYIGCCGCLVFTPLTARCYLTLAQSLKLHMGGAPAGPAGTGKTETVKDMARAIGIAAYVVNCSDQMSHDTLGNIFTGLAAAGCWGCFDEFNRISVEVLSVVATQVRSIFEAVRCRSPTFSLGVALGEDGRPVPLPLMREVGVFVTMNPGYAGRTELPANVKALFRPVAMIVPDVQQISEILLSGEGFVSARSLAVKFARCYTYAKQQLSAQMQYDWGLRSMRAVLLVAGNAKRAAISKMRQQQQMAANRNLKKQHAASSSSSSSFATIAAAATAAAATRSQQQQQHQLLQPPQPQRRKSSIKLTVSPAAAAATAAVDAQVLTLSPEQESLIFARALYTSNLAKLHLADVALLRRLIVALFPDVPPQALTEMGDVDTDTQKLLGAVRTEASALFLSLGEDGAFNRKISQLLDAMRVRHSIFIMGPPLSGKTALWRLMAAAYEAGAGLKPWIEVIEPKSLTSDELYGYVHPQSHEWFYGIISKTFRAYATATASSSSSSSPSSGASSGNGGGPDDAAASSPSSPSASSSPQTASAAAVAAPKWIVMDGQIEPMWIETMNSVMDDNKLLTLPNNERISMTPSMRLIFEIGDLAQATPATVSRAGIIIMNEGDVTWTAVKDRFVALYADPAHRAIFDALLEKHMSTAFIFAQESMPREAAAAMAARPRQIEWTRSVCSLFQGVILRDDFRACHPLPIEIVEPLFVWCIGIVLGSTIPHVVQAGHVGTNMDQRFTFSSAFRRHFPIKFAEASSASFFDFQPVITRHDQHPEGAQPVGTVIVPWTPPAPTSSFMTPSMVKQQQQQQSHHPASQNQQQQQQFLCFRFLRWDNAAPEKPFAMHPTTPWSHQLVPAPDALRAAYLAEAMLTQPDCNVMLIGPPCSAKSLLARNFWLSSSRLTSRYLDTKDPFARACTVSASSISRSAMSDESNATGNEQNQIGHSEATFTVSQRPKQQEQQPQPQQQPKSRRLSNISFVNVTPSPRVAGAAATATGGGKHHHHTHNHSPAASASYETASMRAAWFSWSYTSTREQAQPELEQLLERRGPHSLGPVGGGHLVLVIDDINLPEKICSVSLLRQVASLKMLYDKERLQSKDVEDVRMLATMDPSREGCSLLDERLAARFFPIVLGVPHEEQVKFILHAMMVAHCSAARMKQDLVNDLARVVGVCSDVLGYLSASFGPTDAFPQHRFTVRDLSRAVEGIARGLRPRISTSTALPAVVIFHLTRAVCDRLGAAGFMLHVTHFIRETVLNRFAENSGAADLLELGGDVIFMPPPSAGAAAAAAASSLVAAPATGDGNSTTTTTTATAAAVMAGDKKTTTTNDAEDPNKAKRPLLGAHTPFACGSVESPLDKRDTPATTSDLHRHALFSPGRGWVNAVQIAGNTGPHNTPSHKTIGLDRNCVSSIVSVDGEGATAALDRVHSAYTDWATCEYSRIDALPAVQSLIEAGIRSAAACGAVAAGSSSSSSALSDFVFFDAALVQIAAAARILATPAGHILMLGLGGSGRRYVLRLAAMYLGYELVTADVSAVADEYKDIQEWRSHISAWQKRAVLKDVPMCIAVTGCEKTTAGGNTILACIHDLLRQGVCFSVMSNEEKEEYVSVIQSSRGTLPTHLQAAFVDTRLIPAPFDSESFVWDSFTIRSRRNLHFAIVMSLIPTQIRRLRRRFPAFVDECQLLHSHAWSKSALFNVCQRMFERSNVVESFDQQQQQQQQQKQEDKGKLVVKGGSVAFTALQLQREVRDDDDECVSEQPLPSADDSTTAPAAVAAAPSTDEVFAASAIVDPDDLAKAKAKAFKHLHPDVARDICDLLAHAHSTVVRQAAADAAAGAGAGGGTAGKDRRRVIISPKHFLQSVRLFIRLLQTKNTDVANQVRRLSEGLLRIDDCEHQVEELKARLTGEREAVTRQASETTQLLRDVEGEKTVVAEQHAIAEVEEQRTRQLVKEVTALVEDCDRELQAALPAVHAAKNALQTLNKQNLTELKSMGKPPADVHAVAACVMCLTTPAGDRIPRDRSWLVAKARMMSDVGKWLRDLQNFEVDSIPDQNVNAVRPTIADPTFNRAVIASKSFAAAGLCEWVINIVKYHDLHQLFVPKERRLADARARQAESEAKLEKVRKRLAEFKIKYDAVLLRYEAAKNEQQRLQSRMEQTEAHLDRAKRLVQSLGGERKRWAASRDALERSARLVAPDMALAASFFVYAGAFQLVQRRKLWDELVAIASSLNLTTTSSAAAAAAAAAAQQNQPAATSEDAPTLSSVDDNAKGTHNNNNNNGSKEQQQQQQQDSISRDDPVSTLFNEADLASWSSCGLPSDSFSRQSAAIVRVNESATSPTVFIDPQHRAATWITESLRQQQQIASAVSSPSSSSAVVGDDLLLVLQPDSPKLMTSLTSAIHIGRHVMIAGVSSVSRKLQAVMDGLAGAAMTQAEPSSPASASSPSGRKAGSASASGGKKSKGTLTNQQHDISRIVSIAGTGEFTLHPNFRLYIQFLSADDDTAVSADCYTLSTVVDFSATEDGFVEQLLDRALQLDRPELQEELTRLLNTMNAMTVTLRQREDVLLEQLSTAGSSILEDESLVSSLERTRAEARQMQATLDTSIAKKQLATDAMRQYLPVALRATTVFLRLQAMRAVDPIYAFSIDPVLEEFDRGVRLAQEELRARHRIRSKELEDTEGDDFMARDRTHSSVTKEGSMSRPVAQGPSSRPNSPTAASASQNNNISNNVSNGGGTQQQQQKARDESDHEEDDEEEEEQNGNYVADAYADDAANSGPGATAQMLMMRKRDSTLQWSPELEATSTIGERIQLMRQKVTECIFTYGTRAIFSSHRLAFAASVCFSVLLQGGYRNISTQHIDTLLRFPRRLECTTVPGVAQWLTLPQWQALDGLSRARLPVPIGAVESSSNKTLSTASGSAADGAAPSANASAATAAAAGGGGSPDTIAASELSPAIVAKTWKQPFSGLLDDIVSNARWRTWVAHSAPETERPPGAWRTVNDIDHLLLVRCLRSDRFAHALRMFVATHLGAFAVSDEQLDLAAVMLRHVPVTPFLFVVSPGADALTLVNDVAARAGYDEQSGTVAHISLGQGQEARALAALQKAYKERTWVVLHNVHLLPSWSFKLERELARLEHECKTLPEHAQWLLREDYLLTAEQEIMISTSAMGASARPRLLSFNLPAAGATANNAIEGMNATMLLSASMAGSITDQLQQSMSQSHSHHQQPSEDVAEVDTQQQFAQPLAYRQKFAGGPQTLTVLCEADVRLLALTESLAEGGTSIAAATAAAAATTATATAASGAPPEKQQSAKDRRADKGGFRSAPARSAFHQQQQHPSAPPAAEFERTQRGGGDNNNNDNNSSGGAGISDARSQATAAGHESHQTLSENTQRQLLRTFRVFLTAEPRDQPLLSNLVTRCIKVVCEPPQGVAANFVRAYSIFSDEPWEGSPRPNEMHGIIFSLCFFHALVTERIKFGAIGWNKRYPFSIEDLKCAAEIAITASEGATRMQWTHLRFFVARIIYGGHIVDPFDMRLCCTYLDALLSPELLESGEIVSGIPMPGRRTHADMMALLTQQFPEEDPGMFHMHAASAARKGTVESQENIAVLSSIVAASSLQSTSTYSGSAGRKQLHQSQQQQQQQGSGSSSASAIAASFSAGSSTTTAGAGGGKKDSGKEAAAPPPGTMIDETIGLLMGAVPESLPVSVVQERLEMEGVDTASPLLLLMLREAERMNRLTAVMRNALESLDLAERGARFMTEQDTDMLASLRRDQIPAQWQALWGTTVRPLGGWIVLITEAHGFLLNWCNEINIPRVICVRYLFSPSALFSALQQDAAAKLGVSLETVDLAVDVLKAKTATASAGSGSSSSSSTSPSVASMFRSAELLAHQHRAREGAILVGLSLDGAAWDSTASAICEAPAAILEACSMPPIAVRGAASSAPTAMMMMMMSKSSGGGGALGAGGSSGGAGSSSSSSSSSPIPPDRPNTYFCPLYRTWRRGESWIISLPLRTREPQSKWITRNVALIADDHGSQ